MQASLRAEISSVESPTKIEKLALIEKFKQKKRAEMVVDDKVLWKEFQRELKENRVVTHCSAQEVALRFLETRKTFLDERRRHKQQEQEQRRISNPEGMPRKLLTRAFANRKTESVSSLLFHSQLDLLTSAENSEKQGGSLRKVSQHIGKHASVMVPNHRNGAPNYHCKPPPNQNGSFHRASTKSRKSSHKFSNLVNGIDSLLQTRASSASNRTPESDESTLDLNDSMSDTMEGSLHSSGSSFASSRRSSCNHSEPILAELTAHEEVEDEDADHTSDDDDDYSNGDLLVTFPTRPRTNGSRRKNVIAEVA